MRQLFNYLILGFVLFINPFFTEAQHIVTLNEIDFDAATGTINNYTGIDTDIIIPTHYYVDGIRYDVSSIGESAFYAKSLINVVLPQSIDTIARRAFSRNKLSAIDIPDGVKFIGEAAFCTNSIRELTIPESVSKIDEFAFNDNDIYQLNNKPSSGIIFSRTPEGTIDSTHIVSYGGWQLNVTFIPETVTTIGNYAFYYNDIFDVDIPNSVTFIGELAFGRNNLSEVEIPNSVTSIGVSAFYNNRLTSVKLPDDLTTIERNCFHINQLTNIELPNTLTSIHSTAFSSNRISEINIPSCVNFIGGGAFNNNSISMVNGKTSKGIIYARNQDGSIDSTKIVSYGGSDKVIDFIPNKVKTIGRSSFYSTNITDVIVPEGVTALEKYSFYNNEISTVSLPNTVYFIDKNSFTYNKINSISLPSPVVREGFEFKNWLKSNGVVVTEITDFYSSYTVSFEVINENPEPVNLRCYILVMNKPGWGGGEGENCFSDNRLNVNINLYQKPNILDSADVFIRSNLAPNNIIDSEKVLFIQRDGVVFTVINGYERRLKRESFDVDFNMDNFTENNLYAEVKLYGKNQSYGEVKEIIYDYIFNPYIWHAPIASPINVGQSLQKSILTEGMTPVCGQFVFKNPDFIPPVGVYQADVVFIPTRSDIYNTIETTALVEVGVSTNVPASSDNVMQVYYDLLSDRLIINTGDEKILDISIYNTQGTLTANFKGNGSNKQRIYLGTKNASICLVKISTTNKIITRKLLLQ